MGRPIRLASSQSRRPGGEVAERLLLGAKFDVLCDGYGSSSAWPPAPTDVGCGQGSIGGWRASSARPAAARSQVGHERVLVAVGFRVGYPLMVSAFYTYRRLRIEATLALAASCGFAVSAKAADADDLYEAAAMMHTHLAAASFLVDKCGTAYPGAKERFQAAFAAWRSRDARAIDRAEALWQEMEMSSPQSAEEALDDQRQAELLWVQVQAREAGQPENIGARRCIAYFDRLVAASSREQSPKMYNFLEK